MDYVSVHTPEEDAIATEAARATWDMLQRAFSNEVITPGTTTLMDVHYWITAERKRQNFEFNFAPSLDLQRFREGCRTARRGDCRRPHRHRHQDAFGGGGQGGRN